MNNSQLQQGQNTTTIGDRKPGRYPDPAHKKIPTDSTHSSEPQSQAPDSESLTGAEEPQNTEKSNITKLHKVHKLHSEPPEDPGNIASHEPRATSHEGEAASPAFTPEQNYVLELIALGGTLSAAAEDLNCTPQAISNWKKRTPHFAEALIQAREEFIRRTADGFHEAECDARRFLHDCLNDYTMKPHLRLRAAFAILNRKGKSTNWLPDPINSDPIEPEPEGPTGAANPEEPKSTGKHPAPTKTEPCPSGQGHTQHRAINEPRPTARVRPPQTHPQTETPRAASTEPCPSGQGHTGEFARAAIAKQRPMPETPSGFVSQQPLAPILNGNSAEPEGLVRSAQVEAEGERPGKTTRAQRDPSAAAIMSEQTRSADATPSGHTVAVGRTIPITATSNVQSSIPETRPAPEPIAQTGHTEAETGRTEAQSGHIEAETTTFSLAAPNAAPSETRSGTSHEPSPSQKRLDDYTVLRGESRQHYRELHAELQASYEPESPTEELTILRLTQVFWTLRRIDGLEAAVWESAVETQRTEHPNLPVAAAMALSFLDLDANQETRFHERIQKWRAQQEGRVDQLTNQLLRLRQQRESNERYRQRRAEMPAYEKAKPIRPGIDHQPKGDSRFSKDATDLVRKRIASVLRSNDNLELAS